MQNLKRVVLSVLILVLLASCASSYKTISPRSLNYSQSQVDPMFAYKYDVLKQAYNKKLAKKEDKTKVRVVAIRITNTTSAPLKYGTNYRIYAGSQEVRVLPVTAVTKVIKQNVPIYLLYLLLTPLQFNVSTPTSQSSTPVGLVVGPGVTALNMGIAASANKNFKRELEGYNILDKEIKSGETEYGLIGISSSDFSPLSLKVVAN